MDFLKLNKTIKLRSNFVNVKNTEKFGIGVVVGNSDKFLGIITLGDLSKIIKRNPMLLKNLEKILQ